jgi:hypothetical protein
VGNISEGGGPWVASVYEGVGEHHRARANRWRCRWGQTAVRGGRHQWLPRLKKKTTLEEDVVVAVLGLVTGHAWGDDDGARSGSS